MSEKLGIGTKVIIKKGFREGGFKGEIEGYQSFVASGVNPHTWTNTTMLGYRIYVYDGYDYQSKVDSDVIVYGDTKGCTVSLLASDVEVDTQYYRDKKLNEILKED